MRMKHSTVLSLLLSVNLALAAAGFVSGFPAAAASTVADQEVGDVTVGELQEANSRQTLCGKYDQYQIHTVNWLADESKAEEDRYVSRDQLVYENEDGIQVQDDTQADVYGYDKIQAKGFRYLFMDGGYDDYILHNPSVEGFTATGKETFKADASKEGEVTVESTVSDLSQYDAEYFDNFGYSKDDIKSMTVKYVYDAETLEIKTRDSFLQLAEGNQVSLSSSTFNYDGEAYQISDSISSITTGNDKRSFTLIADPGTEREKTYTQTAQKGNMIVFYPFGGYEGLFTDKECTTEYVSGEDDDQKNITVYTTVK